MRLFCTVGSWGEISPLLSLALQTKNAEFATTEDYAERVERYGIKCHVFPNVRKHEDTLNDFLLAHFKHRTKTLYETIERAKPDSIVASFYFAPAAVYADNAGISCLATTTTPYYFMGMDAVDAFRDIQNECKAFRFYDHEVFCNQLGLYPWYLHEECGFETAGYPELPPIEPLSDEVKRFIEEPYGVISMGTLVKSSDLNRMVNAIHAHGLKALYLGKETCNADLCVPFANHFEAVKNAQVCITHAGVGTTVDCIGKPMVVSPLAYDQFYNAARLYQLKAAVPYLGSYIEAIKEAFEPRSYLPNTFSLKVFNDHANDSAIRQGQRPAANAQKRAQVH